MVTNGRLYILLAAFLALRTFGNLALALGMKHLPALLSTHVPGYLRSMLDPYVAGGIVMLIIAVPVRVGLLSLADLSFVLPTTAIGYVLAALSGQLFLHEAVGPRGWLAVGLIFGGAALVGSTPRHTTAVVEKGE